MLERIVGRKIELLPKEPNENQVLCNECGGLGWLMKDEKWIENCPHCCNGLIDVCPQCKQPYKKRYRHYCDNPECKEKDRIDNDIKAVHEELKRFEKAKKVSYDECPADSKVMMYSEHYGYNEGYFTDLEDLLEYTDSEDIQMPKYVWATSEIPLSMNADSIIEDACSDLHEDARDNITNEKELQEFLDKWCERQGGVNTYYMNYKVAIWVPEDILNKK